MRIMHGCLFAIVLASQCLGGDIITFRLVHPDNDALRERAKSSLRNNVPGYEVITNSFGTETNVLWVTRKILFSDQDIAHIELRTNVHSRVSTILTLTQEQVAAFGRTPGWHNRALALSFQEKVFITPPLGGILTGNGIVLDGVLSATTAQELKRAVDEKPDPQP